MNHSGPSADKRNSWKAADDITDGRVRIESHANSRGKSIVTLASSNRTENLFVNRVLLCAVYRHNDDVFADYDPGSWISPVEGLMAVLIHCVLKCISVVENIHVCVITSIIRK